MSDDCYEIEKKKSHTRSAITGTTTTTNPAELEGCKAREKDNPLPSEGNIQSTERENMADLTQPISTVKV